MQEEAVGQVFWHPKGYALYRALEDYVRRRVGRAGYQEVKSPLLIDRKLWEMSGHWENYREHMFVAEVEDENLTLAVKPMNCPGHVQIFKQGMKSYRELPLRLAEFGACHRYEPSGALHGLLRVRGFTQDDAHIFCTHEQITAETAAFCRLLLSMYRDLGFEDVRVKLATRPTNRIGGDNIWDSAETALKDATAQAGVEYALNPGEGAFYGPKLEFVLRDSIGRDWQCGTLQVDFNTADRLGASYIAEDGAKHVPVMLHRAVLGSMERFIGVLIEHYAGKFPLWLAPGPGGGRDHRVGCRFVCPGGGRGAQGRGSARGNRSAERKNQLQGPRAQPGQGPVSAGRRPARGRKPHTNVTETGVGRARKPCLNGCYSYA